MANRPANSENEDVDLPSVPLVDEAKRTEEEKKKEDEKLLKEVDRLMEEYEALIRDDNENEVAEDEQPRKKIKHADDLSRAQLDELKELCEAFKVGMSALKAEKAALRRARIKMACLELKVREDECTAALLEQKIKDIENC